MLFTIIRAINKFQRKEDAKVEVSKAPEIPADVKLLGEIQCCDCGKPRAYSQCSCRGADAKRCPRGDSTDRSGCSDCRCIPVERFSEIFD